MEKYVFKTTHEPLPINQGLAKLSNDNPSEWALICGLIETSEEFSENAQEFIAKIIQSWNLGQLIEHCLDKLPSGHILSATLCDLVDDYCPIKLDEKNLQLETVQAELGTDLCFTVQAQGVPSLVYHWYFWPQNAENQSDWIPLEVHGNQLHIDDLCSEDIGLYR